MPVPSSGTIRIVPKAVAVKSGAYTEGPITGFPACGNELAALSDAAIAAYLNADGGLSADAITARQSNEVFCAPTCFGVFPAAGLHQLKFTIATDAIIFNPGGSQQVIDILTSDFPPGVLITALRVSMIGTVTDGGVGTDIVDLHLIWGITNVHTVAAPNIVNTTVQSASNAIIATGTHQGFLTTLTFLGVDVTLVDATVISTGCGDFDTSQSTFAIRNLRFTMNYILWSQTLSLSPTSVTQRALPETVFTLTADDKLDQLEELNAYTMEDNVLSAPIPITIISQTPTTITFTIPDTEAEELLIFGTGNGDEFTGQVQLGLIILVNGAGIYKLTPGKRNDTYYDRSVNPATTIDLKIPNPTARTGYL